MLLSFGLKCLSKYHNSFNKHNLTLLKNFNYYFPNKYDSLKGNFNI